MASLVGKNWLVAPESYEILVPIFEMLNPKLHKASAFPKMTYFSKYPATSAEKAFPGTRSSVTSAP